MKTWIISDVHEKWENLRVPEVECLIFAGDIGTTGVSVFNATAVNEFIIWLESLDIKHKIWIAGNHDTSIDRKLVRPKEMEGYATKWMYLEHESFELVSDRIIKFFGSPYTPSFGENWGFNVKRHKLDSYWAEIPEDTDVLITHGPPMGILDSTESGVDFRDIDNVGNISVYQCGCKALLRHVKRVEPKYHIFGHIHPETNCPNHAILDNGETKFINASVLNLRYEIDNNGWIIDL